MVVSLRSSKERQMSSLERVIHSLRSYNFTKKKIAANIAVADFLEDVNAIIEKSNAFTAVFDNSKIKTRTKQLIDLLEENGKTQTN